MSLSRCLLELECIHGIQRIAVPFVFRNDIPTEYFARTYNTNQLNMNIITEYERKRNPLYLPRPRASPNVASSIPPAFSRIYAWDREYELRCWSDRN